MVEYFRKKRTQKAGTKSKYNSVHGQVQRIGEAIAIRIYSGSHLF